MLHCDLFENFIFMCAYTVSNALNYYLLIYWYIYIFSTAGVGHTDSTRDRRRRHTCSSHQHGWSPVITLQEALQRVMWN